MKSLIFAALMAASQFSLAQSRITSLGGEAGGGGDASEMRVNEIRSDILKWIQDGGSQGLSFGSNITLEEYENKMIPLLQPQFVEIGFVENDDSRNDEQRVMVRGQPKTCRGFFSKLDRKPHILCHLSRFAQTSASDQYKLIHHEYAGLAYLERNEGAASDYALSNQITDYLVVSKVLKLAVKKQEINSETAECMESLGVNREPYTPLVRLAYCGNSAQEIRDLVNQGHSVNDVLENGISPLMASISNEHSEILRVLLELGANPNTHYRPFGVIGDDATFDDHYDLFEHALYSATIHGNEEKVKALIKAGADVNALTPHNFTAILGATFGSTYGAVQALVEAGARVNDISTPGQNRTPLMMTCVRYGSPAAYGRKYIGDGEKIIQLLLGLGADKMEKNKTGQTAYDFCKENQAPGYILKMLK